AWNGFGNAPPMPPGSYTPRAVSDAPVQPAVARASAPDVRPAAFTSASPPPVPRAAPNPPPPATPSQPPARARAPTLASLKANIERVCAGRGRDLDVQVRGPGSLLVKVKVRQAADAEDLANRISQLPELGPYQVLFEMLVAR